MPIRKNTALENALGRIDDLDKLSLQALVQRLARERHLLETVFNTVREGILVVDEAGVIDYANTAATAMLGFSDKQQGKAVIWKLLPDLGRTLDFTVDGRFEEVSVISRELELTYPEIRSVRLYIVPFTDEDAHLFKQEHSREPVVEPRFAVILSDITSEKITTRKQIESEAVSSIILLAAGVAHELGNPLNSLTIHLQLLMRQVGKMRKGKERDKLESSLGICLDEVDRLDGIITHFLEAIRPAPPDFQELNPMDVLEESLQFQERELSDSGIRVSVKINEVLPVILADRNQLKQVFFNLLKNAREAMPGGGTIKVHAGSDEEFVTIRIGDNGNGIAEEDLSRLFQPYFSTKENGHGLGMMIVQRIINAHGGQIGVDSRPDVGTVVTLQFPQKHRRVRLLKG